MKARKSPRTNPRGKKPLVFANEDERNLHFDFEHKRVSIPPPSSVGDVVNKLLARKGYARIQANLALGELWKKVAGERIASDSRPGLIANGVWQVFVRNSSVVQELSFSRTQILKQIQTEAPEQKIRDVKFKVGPID